MINEFATNPANLPPLKSDRFGSNGRVITAPKELLQETGADGALIHKLTLVQGGVDAAPAGAIQDPAGSALGAPKPTPEIAGGGSRAIYKAFPDLEGIPLIQRRSAIFNTSEGAGKRVLHSYSPQLAGNTDDDEDRRKALEDVANTYCNAILAFNARAADLGGDGQLLNLVPVSSVIFAGPFANPAYPPRGHLDPSYTITAIYIAIAALMKSGDGFPQLALYYYDKAVFKAAEPVLAQLLD